MMLQTTHKKKKSRHGSVLNMDDNSENSVSTVNSSHWNQKWAWTISCAENKWSHIFMTLIFMIEVFQHEKTTHVDEKQNCMMC
jgi:hypothetical protein